MAQKTDNQKLAMMIATALAVGVVGSVVTAIPELGRKHADLDVPENYASAPPAYVASFKDLAAEDLLRSHILPHAIVALGAEEALDARDAAFGPDHDRIMGKIQSIVLDASINASAEEIAIIQALRSQGETVAVSSGMSGVQFDGWATDIADFEEKGMAQIEAVAADLAEAGLPRSWSVQYSYDVARKPELAIDLQAEALELQQISVGDVAGPLSMAHERLENTVLADLEKIAAGSQGQFDQDITRSATIASIELD